MSASRKGLSDYREFLARKVAVAPKCGMEPSALPACMKPHQADATAFALRTGRAGLYLDTGLGKTLCELEFCRQAAEATNGRALILTPLAVAKQFEREAAKFGIEARVIREQSEARDGISICNYDRLEKLDPDAFGAISLDESSILKSFSGATSRALRQTFSQHRFRLSATATPAPNDHMELGQHAEFLGVMNSVEMLSKFFINDTSTASQQWRLKGHAEQMFWDWMASWAVMAESPADLGHGASEYYLPPLEIIRHQADGSGPVIADGLFASDANATNIHTIKRATTDERAKLAARVILDGTWSGSRNTLQHVGQNTQQAKVSASGASRRADHPEKTANTCADGTSETQPRSKPTARPPRINETPAAASDTRWMQPTENSANIQRAAGANTLEGIHGSNPISALPSSGTPNSSSCRAGVAQSVELHDPRSTTETSPSIIATPLSASEDCSAQTATKVSESSRTILLGSASPQNTLSGLDWWIVWCDTDYEQAALEKIFGALCFSVRGIMSPDEKEERYFRWESGERKILVSKPSIFGYGMNMQHCCNMFFLGRSFSYETWYQAVRRCWRYGQTRAVTVHLAVAEGEDQIGRVIERKSADHIRMKRMMSAAMRRALGREADTNVAYHPTHYAEVPKWLMAS